MRVNVLREIVCGDALNTYSASALRRCWREISEGEERGNGTWEAWEGVVDSGGGREREIGWWRVTIGK
jgi:hypothetical protein